MSAIDSSSLEEQAVAILSNIKSYESQYGINQRVIHFHLDKTFDSKGSYTRSTLKRKVEEYVKLGTATKTLFLENLPTRLQWKERLTQWLPESGYSQSTNRITKTCISSIASSHSTYQMFLNVFVRSYRS
jgi:hypothetical protein